MKRIFLFLILTVFLGVSSFANKPINNNDTIPEWPYALPLLGKKATALGYKIQLPHGLMSNTYFNQQQILISDLKLSFDNNPLISLDDIVKFGDVNATVVTTNIRIDTWILPFLNIYGYGGIVSVNMDVNLSSPIEISTSSENPGNYFGGGVMIAGKAGPLFISGDFNLAWTNLRLLKEPTLATIMGLRVGHRFNITNKPGMNIAIWGGVMGQILGNTTEGSIAFEDALDLTDSEVKEIEDWYDGIDDGPVKDFVGEMIEELATPTEAKLNYSIKKDLKHALNPVVGMQWQLTDHWQLRGELGFLTKQQTLLSINYRFGIKSRTSVASSTIVK